MKISAPLRLCVFLFAASRANSATNWPAAVPDFTPPAPNEHPRLFFRKADVPRLRERAKTPEGKAIIARLKVLLGGGDAMPTRYNDQTRAYEKKQDYPVGTYSVSHAAGFGFLYQLTGEKNYAQLGRECFEKAWAGVRDIDGEARYSWVRPGGMLRAGPSLGWYALGYDLCADGWDEDFRKKVAAEIQNYNQPESGQGAEGGGSACTLERLATNPKHPPGSNHYATQVGGAALALLAIKGDAGTDDAKTSKWLEAVEKNIIVELTKGWGDHGWFDEGDGPGCIASDTSFVPALQAFKIAGGKDFITPRTNAQWMMLKWPMLSLPGGKNVATFPIRGTYEHNVWARLGFSGSGQFSQGFGAIADAEKPALLWLYNHTFKAADDAAQAPFDTINVYPHRAILAFLNWPFGLAEKNPGDILPHAVRDDSRAFYMFRNRWQDTDDCIVTALLQPSHGHYSVNAGPIMVWGLGKRAEFPVKFGPAAADIWEPKANGSGVISAPVRGGVAAFGVDMSGASGAPVLAVMCAPGLQPVNSEKDGVKVVTITAGTNIFIIQTIAQKATAIEARAEADRVIIGEQAISFDGKKIMFAR